MLHFNTPRPDPLRETVSISLPEKLKTALDAAAEASGTSRSDLVREALQEYLFIKRFEDLRRSMISYAERKGVYTDEDVFRQVS